MSEIRVNKIVNEAGTGSVEFAEGVTLPSGKTISGSGTISMDVTGSISGDAGGLTGTPDITINNLVGVAATFTGVLTYEDVTNIDSIGIVTARTGIKVLAGGANIVGVTTSSAGLEVTAGTTYLSGITKEKANVTTTTINSSQTFDLNSGMVHFRNSSAPSATTSNALLTYSPSNVNTFMATNDVLTVTIMCTGASGAYFGGLSIDGASQTVNWAHGSAPTDGSTRDVYVFTIIKTGSSAYTVFGNQTKTA